MSLLNAGVVLFTIDSARSAVLLTVDLPAFRGGQGTTIRCAVIVDFLADRGFAAFEVGGFTGGQLATLHALGNPLLLIALALSYFALRIYVLHA